MFNWIATILFITGTITAAIAASKPQGEEMWVIFAIGVGVILLGAIVRYFARKEALKQPTTTGEGRLGINEISSIIENLPGKCRDILARFDDAQETAETLLEKVDKLCKADLFNLVENRAVLAQFCGSKNYPILFSVFAEGERLINRTWSALCDEHKPEAQASLQQAIIPFDQVKTEFAAIKSRTTSAS